MEIGLREGCCRCGHSWSFHGKSLGATCKAMGCRGGEDGGRCPGFVQPPCPGSGDASEGVEEA